MKIALCSGTKNRFLMIHEKQLDFLPTPVSLAQEERSKLARDACENWGSGADGLVIVKEATKELGADYEWDFYNRDGSSAEMCGNASRCMGYFAFKVLGNMKTEISFRSKAGLIIVRRLEETLYSVKMPHHQLLQNWTQESVLGQEVEYCAWNTGVPQVVVKVSNLSREQLLPLAKHFRFHQLFDSAGTNVSFINTQETRNEGVTFERGVENFTASCGTGVVAMALSLFRKQTSGANLRENALEIETPGGALRVQMDESGQFCWLIGPVELEEVVELLN